MSLGEDYLADYAYEMYHAPKEQRKQTNADRIRSMTDEELRDVWFYILKNVVNRYNSSYLGLLVWLKEEANP